MGQCKRCARNGVLREGGSIGVCSQHAKRKCLICGAPSLGEEMCAPHEHQAEIMRWTAKSQFRVLDPDDAIDEMELRHSKLQESKFLAHQSIEIMFRALHGAVQAIWGVPAAGPEPEADEQRKAA